jgi:hypothetical protein
MDGERAMALKHEFNRQSETGDENIVLRFDATLTHLTDRAAEAWQARTPFSRQGLTLGLYIAAALLGAAYVLLTREFLFLGIALLAYGGSLPGRQRGSLVEEMQLEVTGLPRHTMKYLAVGLLGIALFGIATSLPFVLTAPLTGSLAMSDIAGLIGGVALTVLKVADYIARTNPPGRDGDRERPVERVRRRAAIGAGV